MSNPERSPAADSSSIEDELTAAERELCEWLDQYDQDASCMLQHLPEALRANPKIRPVLDCLQKLESLAIPRPQELFRSESSLSQQLPRQFGPYQLLRELGRGGMGVVYLAEHQTLKSLFALKIMRTREHAPPAEVQRFFQEAQAAAQLQHPHVVSVFDAGEIDGIPFLVMRHINGESLAERLRRSRIPVLEAVRLLCTVASGVAYLHEQGIIHRDLKPSNILLDAKQTPFITDFGLAKVFHIDAAATTTGTVIGTPQYMPPEQAWGRPCDVSPQSDIYSLGAIFYELLTGRPPFPEANPLDQMLRLRDTDPVLPRTLNASIPLELQHICLRCLEKQPRHRYAAAEELARDLQDFLDGEPLQFPTISPWQRLRRWTRREPALVSHLTGFVLVAAVVQLANLVSGQTRTSYVPVMLVLLAWSALSVLLQKLLLIYPTSVVDRTSGAKAAGESTHPVGWTHGIAAGSGRFIREIWIATDATFLTLTMNFAEGPIESLMIGYALLVVASSMWFQPRLVWLMTAASVFAYGVLLTLRGAPQTPPHYPFLVAGMLIVVGGIVATLVNKLRLLLSLRSQAE